jgi:hypothetical protein
MPASKAQRKARARRRNAHRATKYAEKTGKVVNINPVKGEREEPRPVRRKDGLAWLAEAFKKSDGRRGLSPEQCLTGEWFGDVCMEALCAALPGTGFGDGGRGSGKASPGPADWRLQAVAEKRHADMSVLRALPADDGMRLLALLEAVCHEGRTIRDLAAGADYETIRLEERLKMGLAILRVGRFTLLSDEGPRLHIA